MLFKIDIWICLLSFPVQGTWIEISTVLQHYQNDLCRSLYRERGLKYKDNNGYGDRYESFPVQGTWIEISHLRPLRLPSSSFPVQGTWIEIERDQRLPDRHEKSFPVQGTWIEIQLALAGAYK